MDRSGSRNRPSATRSEAAPPRDLGRVGRVVVKVGSGVIAGKGKLRSKVIADLAYDVSVLRHRGCEVIMVVSGAVASGYALLGLEKSPSAVLERQAAASIGQPRMMAALAKAFAAHRTNVAQLLMSADDIDNRKRFLSARHTMEELLTRGVVPILNENDALSEHEATIGDNDHLSALVTNVASADLLIILSRVPGVFPTGRTDAVIPRVDVGSSLDQHITSDLTETGVGGMIAKVSAARLASNWGVPTIIAQGGVAGLLPRVVDGEEIGTLFVPRANTLSSRKTWIAVRKKSRGSLQLDAGACRALVEKNASLLPAGITAVEGRFPMGTRVDLLDEKGRTFAVGLVSYSSDEIRLIKGRRQNEVKQLLGYEYVKEVIHRDDLVILEESRA